MQPHPHITNSLPAGTLLRGPQNTYHIQQALGQGTFGITYLATTQMQVTGQMGSFETTVKVAVKEFFMRDINGREQTQVSVGSQGGLFDDYKRKFVKEAQNLARLQHPGIVRVLEDFEANGTVYYAMEYIEGENMNEFLRHGALSEQEAVAAIRQVASAIDYMHTQHHLLHLDLKPGNIMRRSRDGRLLLIDFGLSKSFADDGQPESSTSVGQGTVGYAPLEQTSYSKEKGKFLPTIDVYALGATLYKLLTRQTPPAASELLNDETLIAERMEQCGVSPRLMAAVVHAMEPRVKDRMPSARAFLRELTPEAPQEVEPVVEETTVVETPQVVTPQPTPPIPPAPAPAPRPGSATWKWGTLVIAIAVTVIGLIAWGMMSGGEESAAQQVQTEVAEEPAEDLTTSTEATSDRQTFMVNGVSFTMVRVEGGTFTMGVSNRDIEPYSFEGYRAPVHEVTLSSYHIGETEVTQALWEAVMGSNPSKSKGADLPVTRVSWNNCQEFIGKLNALTECTFRLPTEAEWEFAARGGNGSEGHKYSGSDDVGDVAWYYMNSDNRTHPVKTKSPNELGLYDMSGNVHEWCQDWHGSYPSSPQSNPTGPSTGSARIKRGGAFDEGWLFQDVAYRDAAEPSWKGYYLGLRLAL